MPVPWKICHPNIAVLLYLLLLNSWWFDGFFSSCFMDFFDDDTDDLVSAGQEKTHDCMLCCIISMQLDLEWKQSGKNHTAIAKFIYPNRNGTVQYPAVRTHTLRPVHLRLVCGGWGGGLGGGGQGFISSMWCVQLLVWQWAFIALLASWSTLEAILFSWSFHLLLDPGYRVSPASHTKHSLVLVHGTSDFLSPVTVALCSIHSFPEYDSMKFPTKQKRKKKRKKKLEVQHETTCCKINTFVTSTWQKTGISTRVKGLRLSQRQCCGQERDC